MRPQDCRRSQWPCCKRCGRSGRPARLLTGRDAAAIVSCAATANSPAPSALPPKVGSALAMPLSSACTPLATAATPPARRDPTPSRSQVGTRCTASTATASCRRHPSWTAEYPPCPARGGPPPGQAGHRCIVRFRRNSSLRTLRAASVQRETQTRRVTCERHARWPGNAARVKRTTQVTWWTTMVVVIHSVLGVHGRAVRTCQLAPEAPPSPDRAFQDEPGAGENRGRRAPSQHPAARGPGE